MNVIEREWYEAMKAKGHMPKMDDDDPGELDHFALDIEGHNGPGCVACGWYCCWHCCGTADIPECMVIDGAVTQVIGKIA